MRMLYISNARLPTKMAHGLQIMQNCEAFAEVDESLDLSLWIPMRFPVPGAEAEGDPYDYYGVKRNFRLRYLPTLDLTHRIRSGIAGRVALYIQISTFAIAVMIGLIAVRLTDRVDIVYSRDPIALFFMRFVIPRRALVYEAHRPYQPGMGQRLERVILRSVGHVVAITPPLRDELLKRQKSPDKTPVMVAHDGIRTARFADMPDKAQARQRIGWREDRFVVGYVGRMTTLGHDKGINTVIDALASLPDETRHQIAVAVVGGPADGVEQRRQRWLDHGLPDENFLYPGHVEPDNVPLYLAGFDVCAMPSPFTEQFAYFTSPIKLFEYMASKRPIIASDFPAYADVVQDGISALLIEPSDIQAMATAIMRLQKSETLCQRLTDNAYEIVMTHHTWQARATEILDFVRER